MRLARGQTRKRGSPQDVGSSELGLKIAANLGRCKAGRLLKPQLNLASERAVFGSYSGPWSSPGVKLLLLGMLSSSTNKRALEELAKVVIGRWGVK